MYLGDGVADVAGVAEELGLLRGGVDQVGVAVAEGVDGDAGGHVEVLAPIDVVELAAVARHEDDLRALVGAHDVLGLVLHGGPGRRRQLSPRGRRRRRWSRGREAGGDAPPPGRREPHGGAARGDGGEARGSRLRRWSGQGRRRRGRGSGGERPEEMEAKARSSDGGAARMTEARAAAERPGATEARPATPAAERPGSASAASSLV